MNAVINGIEYDSAADAKAAIRRATAQARKEEKARNAQYHRAYTLARLALADVANFIQRKEDGRRLTWTTKTPTIKRNGLLEVATYYTSGGGGTFDHLGATPEMVLENYGGDKAVKWSGEWYAIGISDGMVVLEEIPRFMAAHLDAFAAEKEA